LQGAKTPGGCIDLSDDELKVTAEGRLSDQLFAGPPNYARIAGGDAEERALILELLQSACLVDGRSFAEPVNSV